MVRYKGLSPRHPDQGEPSSKPDEHCDGDYEDGGDDRLVLDRQGMNDVIAGVAVFFLLNDKNKDFSNFGEPHVIRMLHLFSHSYVRLHSDIIIHISLRVHNMNM